CRRLFRRNVLGPLVTSRAKRTQVGQFVLAAETRAGDQRNVKRGSIPGEIVNVSWRGAAHFAEYVVPDKNMRAALRRNVGFEAYVDQLRRNAHFALRSGRSSPRDPADAR